MSKSTRWRWKKFKTNNNNEEVVAPNEIIPIDNALDGQGNEENFELYESTSCSSNNNSTDPLGDDNNDNYEGSDDSSSDQSNQRTPGFNRDIVFPQSSLSIVDIKIMISAFSLRHSLSKEGTKDLLKMIEVLAGRPLQTSSYKIAKLIHPPVDAVQYNFYCQHCGNSLENNILKADILGRKSNCNVCNKETVFSSAINSNTLDLTHQLKLFLENPNIQKHLISIFSMIRVRYILNYHAFAFGFVSRVTTFVTFYLSGPRQFSAT
ncbi:unnamed protein product [Brassicogethes aeneus]|uniref:Uncharacterized protein n=1 Tax=Brassicogethes aeneus TaxID=1431903 RepID=A0A9P0FQ84_BRAAE|nr:unnamed protein product [Brassicogethes aeneus]